MTRALVREWSPQGPIHEHLWRKYIMWAPHMHQRPTRTVQPDSEFKNHLCQSGAIMKDELTTI